MALQHTSHNLAAVMLLGAKSLLSMAQKANKCDTHMIGDTDFHDQPRLSQCEINERTLVI